MSLTSKEKHARLLRRVQRVGIEKALDDSEAAVDDLGDVLVGDAHGTSVR